MTIDLQIFSASQILVEKIVSISIFKFHPTLKFGAYYSGESRVIDSLNM